MRLQRLAFGLLSATTALSQSNPQAAVSTLSIGVCLSNGSSGGYGIGGAGNGTGGGGGGGTGLPTVVVTSVSSPYGLYSQLGWYADQASGYLLGGSQTTSSQMSLTYCASFCDGTPFFAVENGDTCLCGSSGPSGSMVGVTGSCTPCSGSAGECCGSDRIGVVYTLNTPTSSSASVVVYTTTDASGNTITTSSTSYSPYNPIPGSSTIISYTTTNSQGSVVTTATTSFVPASSTSVTTITTTNSKGSTITTTSTSVVSVPTGPAGLACGSYYTDSSGAIYQLYCGTDFPGSDLVAVHVDSPQNCLLACSQYFPNPNIMNGASCVAASYGAGNPDGNCYLKYTIAQINPYDGGIFSGRLVSFQPKSPPTTVSASSAPGASHASAVSTLTSDMSSSVPVGVTTSSSSSSFTSSSGPQGGSSSVSAGSSSSSTPVGMSSSGPGSSSGSLSGSSSGSTTSASGTSKSSSSASISPSGASTSSISSSLSFTSTITGSSTSSGTPNPSAAANPCPAGNGNAYIDTAGNPFNILCSVNYPGSDLPAVHEDTFDSCMDACDTYTPSASVAGNQPCVAVSWGAGNAGGNCYLKFAITNIYYNDVGFDSAQRPNYTATNPSLTTQGVVATSSSTTISLSSSISSIGGSLSSSSSSLSSTGGSSSSLSSSTGGSSSSSSSSSSPTSPTTLPVGSLSLSSSSSSSTSSSSSSTSSPTPTSSSSTSSSSSTISTSGPTSTSSSSTFSSSSTTSTSTGSTPEPTINHNPACPADNNTRYTDIFSTTYDVRCGLQIVGSNGYPAHADTFPKCLEYCDILGGCAAVTYLDGAASTDANCYPYSTFTGYNTQSPTGVYSGVPINGPTSNSTSSMVLCPNDNGANYTDTFGNQYLIGCDQNLAGSGPGGTDLRAAVAPSLDGCLLYCSIYNTCVAVDFTGYPAQQNAANCYPKFSVTTTATSATGTSYAQAN